MKKFKGWGALWCNEVGFNNTNLHAHVLFNGPYIDQSTLAEMENQVSRNEVVRQNQTGKRPNCSKWYFRTARLTQFLVTESRLI